MKTMLAAVSTEIWMGVLSAVLGFLGGIGGSIITFWVGRRRRKLKQKRDWVRSERLGVARVDTSEFMRNLYCEVPEIHEENAGGREAKAPAAKGGPRDNEPDGGTNRRSLYDTVREMIRDLTSGIVVATGPSDTGKKTLLYRAVVSCMPHDADGSTREKRRWWPSWKLRREKSNISFYYVKDMTRDWETIRKGVLEWFGIRAEKLMQKKKMCVVYFDFYSLSKGSAIHAVEKIRELYEDIGRLGQMLNFIFAVKITGVDLDLASAFANVVDSPIICKKLAPFLPSQMLVFQEVLRASGGVPMDIRWLWEVTGGRIGRLVSILHPDESKRSRTSVPEHVCKWWFSNFDSTCHEEVSVYRCLALVYLLAAMARRMDPQAELDIRSFVMDIDAVGGGRSSFDKYRPVLQNAFLFDRIDFSATRKEDFHFDDQSF